MIVPILATGDTVFVPVGLRPLRVSGGLPGRARCRAGRVGSRTLDDWINSLALDGRLGLRRASSTDGVLSVFPQACARRCTPAWTVDVPDGGGTRPSPTACSTWGGNGGTSAFDAACGAGGGGCAPLWKAPRAMRIGERLPDGRRRRGSTPGRTTAGCTSSASAARRASRATTLRDRIATRPIRAVRPRLRPACPGRHRLGDPAATAPRRGAVAPVLSATTGCRRPRSRTCP